MKGPIARIRKQLEGNIKLSEWQKAAGAYDPNVYRQLTLEAASPWVGHLAVVSIFDHRARIYEREGASEAKAQRIADGLIEGFDLKPRKQLVNIQGINIDNQWASPILRDPDLVAEELSEKGIHVRIDRYLFPERSETLPYHSSIEQVPDKQLTAYNTYERKRNPDIGVNLATLINAANKNRAEYRGAGTYEHLDQDPYVALTSFVAARIPGIEHPRELVGGAALLMTGVDVESGVVSWERVA